MKRKHYKLAEKFFSDSEMKCWTWSDSTRKWLFLAAPSFCPEIIYHVGTEAPTEPPRPMCKLAGVEFPMPESKPLKKGEEYFYPIIDSSWDAVGATWHGVFADEVFLKRGLVHKTEEAAKVHAKAIAAAVKKAVKEAKKGESDE